MNVLRRCAISFMALMAVGLSLPDQARAKVDATAEPTTFVQQIADQALSALKSDAAVKSGDIARINQIVDQFILPYVDFQKTTRLAAGSTGAKRPLHSALPSQTPFVQPWCAPTVAP